jgi:hypothetical protein
VRLTVSITDQRPKPSPYGVGRPPETEDFERVSIAEANLDSRVVANVLRSIADDLDPTKSVGGVKTGPSGWLQ